MSTELVLLCIAIPCVIVIGLIIVVGIVALVFRYLQSDGSNNNQTASDSADGHHSSWFDSDSDSNGGDSDGGGSGDSGDSGGGE